MVFDDTRNKYYADAIKAIINENSVVMDLGAGLGLHGLIAARVGAKLVYLVEPQPVIHAAARVAKENGLSGNIECFQATAEDVVLPQAVDVIISVFTGNFLLQEDLLPSLFQARDKHLTKNGRMIPDQARMFIQPVTAEELFEKKIGRWSDRSQGIDYSVLQEYAANSIYFEDLRNTDYKPLANPAEILHMDFMTATDTHCKTSTTIEITEDGLCHGFLGWFDIRLGSHWLSTSPEAEKTHWSQAYLPLDPPQSVQKGQQLTFSLQRPEYGEWSWEIKTGDTRQKHSTFLSSPLQPSDLARKSDHYRPALNEKGQTARKVLDQFGGNETAAQISKTIYSSGQHKFRSEAEARRFIAELISHYS